ncbi:MAG: GatB/YqeY domain-containing protein [Chloroflexi bacterium]|nr:GatB/YqeY domain-containing protein [Chloroflexota bacterium]
MTTLKERLQSELGDAMRARDETRKSTLRMLIAAIKNAEIEARAPLDDSGVVTVIQKQVKQRRESILEFSKGDRQDLVDKEQAEIEVLQVYLPEQASREEIEAAARKVIAETGAAGPRDIGKVMPALSKQFLGRADGRVISEIVRALLGP